uniref:Uncharacterized protein n=1 Tax=Arundo donax TaxID=35708 RepID=A0A0A9FWC3_ARUDO
MHYMSTKIHVLQFITHGIYSYSLRCIDMYCFRERRSRVPWDRSRGCS